MASLGIVPAVQSEELINAVYFALTELNQVCFQCVQSLELQQSNTQCPVLAVVRLKRYFCEF